MSSDFFSSFTFPVLLNKKEVNGKEQTERARGMINLLPSALTLELTLERCLQTEGTGVSTWQRASWAFWMISWSSAESLQECLKSSQEMVKILIYSLNQGLLLKGWSALHAQLPAAKWLCCPPCPPSPSLGRTLEADLPFDLGSPP